MLADDLNPAPTRHLPALGPLPAEERVSFENDFDGDPVCDPSRGSILTGPYAHNHGVRGNTLPLGSFQTFCDEGNEEKIIAVHLKGSGYQTA